MSDSENRSTLITFRGFMVTSNALLRVFFLKYGNSTGTLFTIEVEGRQYLVTAQHLIADIKNVDTIELFQQNRWKKLDVKLVGHCKNGIDISVLATNMQLSVTYKLEPTSDGILLGQEVFFIGYPYGLYSDTPSLAKGNPVPFIKRATFSCLQMLEDNTMIVYLDGHNNPGFSGSPVVYSSPMKVDFKITSVISGYRMTQEPVYSTSNEEKYYYRYNTGIIVSYDIKHAVDLIKSNPIGFKIQ